MLEVDKKRELEALEVDKKGAHSSLEARKGKERGEEDLEARREQQGRCFHIVLLVFEAEKQVSLLRVMFPRVLCCHLYHPALI